MTHTEQQPSVLTALRDAPLRTKLQLGLVAVSVSGVAIMVGSSVGWAIWSRTGGPVMLFDPRQDLCQTIGKWGFVVMAAGVIALAFVHGDASLRSRLGRYGSSLFWASVLALLAIPHMTIAEIYHTAVGKGLFAGMAIGFAAIVVGLALDLAVRIRKPQAAQEADGR